MKLRVCVVSSGSVLEVQQNERIVLKINKSLYIRLLEFVVKQSS